MVDSSILIFVVSVLVSGCAMMSAMGFRGRVSVVGIDLGTTYSVVAVSEGGKVRIFRDSQNRSLTASTVAFLKDGVVLVGEAARWHKDVDARHVIYDAKRFIGRRFDDESVAAQAKGYSFQVVQNETGFGVAFSLDPALGHGSRVSAEAVGAHVLKHLMSIVHADLGHDLVTRSVIAVPAGFSADQTRATATAYKKAGLSVARIMPEPVAAAVAYGLQRRANVHHVLVYDFGGGTLDVAILYVQDGSIEVVANGGDNDLGGTDFDSCIENELAAQVAATAASTSEVCANACAKSFLAQLSERMKIRLSDEEHVVESCCGGAVQLQMTQEDFFFACSALFQRATAVVHATLADANLTTDDIDEVVVVGGTSRMPKVREDLRWALKVDHLNTEIDPDVTVAYGAASILD
ncbi:heat shock protein 70 family [Pelagophyceae sp. CCMP2097]|nr:heat shock protein 70 family [Pelagophyceae sp. CCMP2097]